VLAELVTGLGVDPLFARALHVAAREFPFLADAAGTPGLGTRIGEIRRAVEGRAPAEAAAALVAVFAAALWLAEGLVGEELTRRLVYAAWPELARKGAD
jgi:hypothetical protein